MIIISGSKFDFTASNYCGSEIYPVKDNDFEIDVFKSLIPDNIFNMTREELSPVVKKIMERMNILWSSTGGVANFPEKFGEHTKLSIRPTSIYMSGKGWSVTIYNGRYDVIQPEISKNLKNILNDSSMSDEEKSNAFQEICGPMATPIG